METMITTGDEKHLARAKLRASSLTCSPFFSAAQRTAACRAPTKRSRPSPENTWKRQGWVNLWLGAPVGGVEQLLDPLPRNLGGKVLFHRAARFDCGERIARGRSVGSITRGR